MGTLPPFIGFACIACFTWWFSSRPRLFLQIFVPREEWFPVGRQILRHAEFRRGMRILAGLQLAMGGLLKWWLRTSFVADSSGNS
ncbi:hypothetical protein [Tuwongella immobilis]|uniref:Uncharacterized protein n=1 Tax=Tuwongella immobilis TaxID=692036 RepID=A0A6C2YVJ9_9BACT|nr:hypothetical protein [Tuwongella immobilis]VIP05464.1 unnamed protein product [Tuwongella immobilis]VTS08284.1 unnamed protein product [Tuwongella immobilis]